MTVARRRARAVPLEQAVEVDVDQLVAVQREHVAVLQARSAPRSGSPPPRPSRSRLPRAGDLDAEAGEALLELRLLAGRAADDHALDPRAPQPADLPREQRPAADLARATSAVRPSPPPSARPCRPRGRSPPSPRPVVRRAADPLDRESGRAQRRPGRACCARRSGPASAWSPRRRPSRPRRVAATRSRPRAASAPAAAASIVSAISTPCRSRPSTIGSQALTSAPSASSRPARTRLGASRMSSVCGLKASPSSATFRSRSEPRWLVQLPDHAPLLELVHLDHRVEQLEVVARVRCQLL